MVKLLRIGTMDQHTRIFQPLPLRLNLTRGQNCSYLPEQVEQRLAADISSAAETHDRLAETGFRRIENWVYRPACPHCNACQPIRLRCDRFSPSRTQARLTRKNADLHRSRLENAPDLEHYALFQHYLSSRHEDGQMSSMSFDEFTSMITNSPIRTSVLEYRDDEGELKGCMLFDIQRDGLSAVYSFFDPYDTSRSLGSYMILDMIAMTGQMQLNYLYLGYYVSESRKMAYKAKFRPYEIFTGGSWQEQP